MQKNARTLNYERASYKLGYMSLRVPGCLKKKFSVQLLQHFSKNRKNRRFFRKKLKKKIKMMFGIKIGVFWGAEQHAIIIFIVGWSLKLKKHVLSILIHFFRWILQTRLCLTENFKLNLHKSLFWKCFTKQYLTLKSLWYRRAKIWISPLLLAVLYLKQWASGQCAFTTGTC